MRSQRERSTSGEQTWLPFVVLGGVPEVCCTCSPTRQVFVPPPQCSEATCTYHGVGHHVVRGKLGVQPLAVLLLDGVAIALSSV